MAGQQRCPRFIYKLCRLIFEDTQIQKRQCSVEEEVVRPTVIMIYNNGMFGVDRMDQRLSSFPIMCHSLLLLLTT